MSLVPEKRPDKNGNRVTRWVRAFGKPVKEAKIPSPAIQRRRRTENEVMELCGVLQPANIFDSRGLLATNVNLIADNDPELLKRITHAVKTSPFEADFWDHKLGRGTMILPDTEEGRAKLLNSHRNAFVINPLVKRIGDSGGNVLRIRDCGELNRIVTTMLDSTSVEQPSENFVAAVTIIAYLKDLHHDDMFEWGAGPGPGMSYPDVTKDADFIAERLDEVEALLPEFRARKAWTRESMEVLLNSPVRALREGEL